MNDVRPVSTLSLSTSMLRQADLSWFNTGRISRGSVMDVMFLALDMYIVSSFCASPYSFSIILFILHVKFYMEIWTPFVV